MTTGNEVISRFERFCPQNLAESWDHVGLQVGNPNRPVHKLMTTLDVRPEVVQEAIERQVDFIFAHHPIMFHPAKDLDTRNPQNQMYADLLNHQITVYAAHTNLDAVSGGMNDWLAEKLGLTDTRPLLSKGETLDERGSQGMGRVGMLNRSMTYHEFANYCLKVFNLHGLRLISPLDVHPIRRVAVLGGSGGQFWPAAVKLGADAYVTGDVSYHVAHDMIANKLLVADVGHHVEAVCIEGLAELLTRFSHEDGWDFQICHTEVNTDPYQYIVK